MPDDTVVLVLLLQCLMTLYSCPAVMLEDTVVLRNPDEPGLLWVHCEVIRITDDKHVLPGNTLYILSPLNSC